MIENNKEDFLEHAGKKILICDGAMGTSLQAMGITKNADSLNIKKNDIAKIIDIHLSFLEAGSDIIQTNTFGSNAAKLEAYGLLKEFKEINKNAVLAAKEAIKKYRETSTADRPLFIAGNVGPLGKLLEPAGTISFDAAFDLFSSQIELLLQSGVDLLLVETIIDLNEALAAVQAARKISAGIPLACTLSFDENGVTVMGNRAEDAAVRLIESGCDFIGANCSIGSDSMLAVVKKIRKASPDGKLIFQPNAGLPQFLDGKTIYNETPEIMASNIGKFIPYGPSVLGACCGSTPDHIRAIVKAVRN